MDAREASNRFQMLAPSLKEIFEGLRIGTSKFEYGRTSIKDWQLHLRFSGDALRFPNVDSKGSHYRRSFRVVPSRVKTWTAARHINESRAVASDWFIRELIPSIKKNERLNRHFVAGDPGAGKSTLLKYLINTHWNALREARIIFSKFEFMKFMTAQWYTGRDSIAADIDNYLSYILLRDLVTTTYFSLPQGDKYEPFLVKPANLRKELIQEVEEAFAPDADLASLSPDVYAQQLYEVITAKDYEPKRLADIPALIRLALVRQLAKGRTMCVILDGLDHVSIPDSLLQNERQFVLTYIFSHINSITSFRTFYPNGIELPLEALFVVRENTLLVHEASGHTDVNLGRPKST